MKRREDYLAEWGLPPNATDSDIRKAYRLLAKTYHPDVNSSLDAHQKFVRLQKVYDALLYKVPEQPSNTATEERRKRKAEAAFAAREASKAYSKRLRHTMYTLYGILNLPCYFLTLSIVLVLTDWILPFQTIQVKVAKAIDYQAYVTDYSTGEGSLSYEYLVLADGRRIVLDIGALPAITSYQEKIVLVEESVLFRHIRQVTAPDNTSTAISAANYLYDKYWFLHFFNLMLLLQYFRLPDMARFKIHFGILSALMGLVQLIAWNQTLTL